MHGLVVAAGHVAAACPAPGLPALQQWDVLLLLNLLGASPSLRHSGEAMSPLCLPRYNSGRAEEGSGGAGWGMGWTLLLP